ncbi:MAG: hypothetical protein AAFP02_24300, partial [Bacteroidota bacterium]
MKETTLEKVRAIIEERKRKATEDQAAQVEHARAQAAETIRLAQREADVMIANTTFQFILFVHDNIIHEVKPDGSITPFVPSSFRNVVSGEYTTAMERYAQQMARYKPTVVQEVSVVQPRKVWPYLPETVKMRVVVPNPTPPPKVPTLPPFRTQELNPAVADIIVDVESNQIFWGRWAAPFAVYKMNLDTKQVTELYRAAKPVTSVALGLKTNQAGKRRIYWMEGNELIRWGTIDGASRGTGLDNQQKNLPATFLNITAPDRGGLWQMEVDFYNKRVYWTNDISIWRADLVPQPERTSLMVISPAESSFPIDLAVDGYNGYLYW